MLLAQPVEGAGAPDALERRVQPERGENRGIDRGPPRVPFDRANGRIERREIEALDEVPYAARAMVGGQQPVEIDGPHLQLRAIRALYTWRGRLRARRARRLQRRQGKQ